VYLAKIKGARPVFGLAQDSVQFAKLTTTSKITNAFLVKRVNLRHMAQRVLKIVKELK